MRLEMPDRYSDIQDSPVTSAIIGAKNTAPRIPTPSVTMAYRAALPPSPNFHFEAAKCLYLLVSMGLGDPDAMAQFSEDEIARDDLDGMRYFVDGWGQPIYFIRWPAGFSSPLQPWNVNPTDVFNNAVPTTNRSYPVASDHDQTDPLNAYGRLTAATRFSIPMPRPQKQFHPALYPLIFSAGPDQIPDVYLNRISGGNEFRYATQATPPNNPYQLVNNGLFGAPADLPSIYTPSNITNQQGDGVDNSIDNVTNQDLSEAQ